MALLNEIMRNRFWPVGFLANNFFIDYKNKTSINLIYHKQFESFLYGGVITDDLSGLKMIENVNVIFLNLWLIHVLSCPLKYISPVEIYIFSLKTYISFSKWRPPDRNNTSQQLKDTSLLMRNTLHPL